VTLACANRKHIWCERIRSIFVASLVLVQVGSLPHENLCLISYLAFQGIRVMDHVFCVGAEVCMTQVIGPE